MNVHKHTESLLSNMFLKTSLTILLLGFILISGRPHNKTKQKPSKADLVRNGRLDVALRSRDHGFELPSQGDCPEGWYDGKAVGLGCVFPDLGDQNVNETIADTVCKNFGEDGRLVEILK